MKFTRASLATLSLPDGKADHIEFDDSLPGFGIRLRAGGSRSWVVQYRAGGTQHRESLGDFRKLDLDQARRAAKRKLGAVALGHDPHQERREAKRKAALTLGAVLPRYMERKRGQIRASSFKVTVLTMAKRWQGLHDIPLHEITRRDIAGRLGAIAAEYGPGAASAARSNLMEFMAWCMMEGLLEANPVIGVTDYSAGPPRSRVLADSELAAIWGACGDDDPGRIVQLLILTGCRRAEISDLRWSEISPEFDLITLPPHRTKQGREHRIPIVGLARSILTSLPSRSGELVFGKDGAKAGFQNWTQAKRELDGRISCGKLPATANTQNGRPPPWLIHDIRRSFSTRLNELGVLPHIVESALGHVWGDKIGRTYNHAQYRREIAAAYALWDDHIRSILGGERKIIDLASARTGVA